MTNFTLLPAVDLLGGQAVQLVQGVAGSQKVFGDPLAAARRWQQEGAGWLHLVDLDAAFGQGDNAAIAGRIVAESGLAVELTGGIRDQASLERALGTGCARVNLGTAAIERPDWAAAAIAQDPDRVAISLDVKNGHLAGRGWTTTGPELAPVVERFNAAGCRRYVVTDVGSDGMMAGPNFDLLRQVLALAKGRPGSQAGDGHYAKVTASGGIASLDDLRQLAALTPLGLDSAIVGTALYLGSFSLPEALETVAPND